MDFSLDVKKEVLSNISYSIFKNDIISKKVFIFACLFFSKDFQNNNINSPYQKINDLFRYVRKEIPLNDSYDDFIHILTKEENTYYLKIFFSIYFILNGEIYNPEKQYRLYLSFKSKLDCETVISFSKLFNFKIFKRHKDYVLYLHESESIEDFLIFINAKSSGIKLMDIKIYKSVRNHVNRIINCETSNISKTITAATSQIEDIKYIVSKRGWDFIPDDLIDIALIRFQNPEMSLSEIDKYLKVSIGKSAINNRFKKLSKIAKKIKEGEDL